MSGIPVWPLAAVLIVAARPAAADVYVFVDADGVTHVSDLATDARYTLAIKEPRRRAQSAPAATAPRVVPPALAAWVSTAAQEHALDPALLHAVISVESGFNPRAQSPKGAQGLMQLMPETARRLGVQDAWDPQQNIQGGARYLRGLLDQFDGNLELALAAYNAGENAVLRYGRQIPPYRETLAYVPRVLAEYASFGKRPR